MAGELALAFAPTRGGRLLSLVHGGRELLWRDPALLDDVLFGAAACLVVEGMVGAHVLAAWESGTSSLRRPLPADGVPA